MGEDKSSFSNYICFIDFYTDLHMSTNKVQMLRIEIVVGVEVLFCMAI